MSSTKMVIVLVSVACICAIALAIVDYYTYPVIAKNKLLKQEQARKYVVCLYGPRINLSIFPRTSYNFKNENNQITFTISKESLKIEKVKIKNKTVLSNVTIPADKKGFISLKSLKCSEKIKSFIKNALLSQIKLIEIPAVRLSLIKNNTSKTSLYPLNRLKDNKFKTIISGNTLVFKKRGDGIHLAITTINSKKIEKSGKFKFKTGEILNIGSNKFDLIKFYKVRIKEKFIGFVFKVTILGFADKIVTIVGVKENMAIQAIKILSQAETPGLGARILEVKKGEVEPWFQSQFRNLTSDKLKIKKEQGAIDAITAATITSKKLTDGIRKALNEFIEFKKKYKI